MESNGFMIGPGIKEILAIKVVWSTVEHPVVLSDSFLEGDRRHWLGRGRGRRVAVDVNVTVARSLAQKVTYERFCGRLEYFRIKIKTRLRVFRNGRTGREDNEEDYVNVLDQA